MHSLQAWSPAPFRELPATAGRAWSPVAPKSTSASHSRPPRPASSRLRSPSMECPAPLSASPAFPSHRHRHCPLARCYPLRPPRRRHPLHRCLRLRHPLRRSYPLRPRRPLHPPLHRRRPLRCCYPLHPRHQSCRSRLPLPRRRRPHQAGQCLALPARPASWQRPTGTMGSGEPMR